VKIFLDTNVLVSSVATRGLCSDLMREIFSYHQLVISPELLKEIEHVLDNKLGLPKTLIYEFIDIIKQDSVVSHSIKNFDIEINDKSDLPILSSALNGEVEIFVTGDKELLEIKKINNMKIISPREYWEILTRVNKKL